MRTNVDDSIEYIYCIAFYISCKRQFWSVAVFVQLSWKVLNGVVCVSYLWKGQRGCLLQSEVLLQKSLIIQIQIRIQIQKQIKKLIKIQTQICTKKRVCCNQKFFQRKVWEVIKVLLQIFSMASFSEKNIHCISLTVHYHCFCVALIRNLSNLFGVSLTCHLTSTSKTTTDIISCISVF